MEAVAKLKNCPTSPRKMRIVADTIRGKSVEQALNILKFSKKEASNRLEKLLMSAISNWQMKNEGERVEESALFVKEIFVDSARMLKRFRPAPMGRAHRIRKRSNHVTIAVDSSLLQPEIEEPQVIEEAVVEEPKEEKKSKKTTKEKPVKAEKKEKTEKNPKEDKDSKTEEGKSESKS